MMKNLFYIFLVTVSVTSCSGIRMYTFYTPSQTNEKWNGEPRPYTVTNLSYDITVNNLYTVYNTVIGDDTLFAEIVPGNDGLFFGPAFVPVFPVCLWNNNRSRLKVSCYFNMTSSKEIDFNSIRFIINGKKEIFPTLITPKYMFYFAEELTTVKELSIRIDDIKIDNEHYTLSPLYLKRKRISDYRPYFSH